MPGDRFVMHEQAKEAINQSAFNALAAVKPLDIPRAKKDTFPSEFVISASITDDDIVGEPISWMPLTAGGMGFVFSYYNSLHYGLTERDYSLVSVLSARILKIKWVQESIGEKFIEKCFVNWARLKLAGISNAEFSHHFVNECEKSVRVHDVWVPVQHLQVEKSFQFGISNFAPMTKAIFDDYEARCQKYAEDVETLESIRIHLERTRKKIQGYAAVSVKIEADHNFASTRARNLCDDAVSLLRLFSIASVSSSIYSPVDLMGASSVPTYNYFTVREGGIDTEGSGVLPQKVAYWTLRSLEIDRLKAENMDEVGRLLDSKALSEFGKIVRSAALSFSRALTFPSLSDRVLFALSSVEGLLLKDGGEPIQQNVGDRMAFLIGHSAGERISIVENLKKIYSVRSQYIHHRIGAVEERFLDAGFQNIRATIFAALANLEKFKSRQEFLEAIERRKYS